MVINFCRNGLVSRIGTSLNVSTPPAITADACPLRILSAAAQIAAFDEMHAYWNEMKKEKPAFRISKFEKNNKRQTEDKNNVFLYEPLIMYGHQWKLASQH